MKKLRRIHLYLGCFFAPLLLFYVATGWYQTMNPDRRKGAVDSDTIVSRLTRVHVEQYYPTSSAEGYSTQLFNWLVVLMSVCFIATVTLGIVLAFRASRKQWPVWFSLAMGILVPVIVLWLGGK